MGIAWSTFTARVLSAGTHPLQAVAHAARCQPSFDKRKVGGSCPGTRPGAAGGIDRPSSGWLSMRPASNECRARLEPQPSVEWRDSHYSRRPTDRCGQAGETVTRPRKYQKLFVVGGSGRRPVGALPRLSRPPWPCSSQCDPVLLRRFMSCRAKLRLGGTPTPRSRVARMTKRLTPTGAGRSASRRGGSAIGVVHAERRDSPDQSIRPAGRTVRATGCTECKSEVGA